MPGDWTGGSENLSELLVDLVAGVLETFLGVLHTLVAVFAGVLERAFFLTGGEAEEGEAGEQNQRGVLEQFHWMSSVMNIERSFPGLWLGVGHSLGAIGAP